MRPAGAKTAIKPMQVALALPKGIPERRLMNDNVVVVEAMTITCAGASRSDKGLDKPEQSPLPGQR